MALRPRRTGPWLAAAWVAGTVAAVVISVVAVNLAGAKVTARPIASVSRSGVEQALAGDATVLVRDDSSGGPDDSTAVDDHGGSVSGTDASSGSGSDDRGSGSGGDSSGSGSDDGGSGSGGGSGSDDGGSGGGSGSPTTTDHDDEHDGTTTTTAVPSAPASKTVSGNTVTIRCTGDTIALLSATAASGFSKDVDKSGPQEVKVQFDNDATDTEVEIQATCSHGAVRWG